MSNIVEVLQSMQRRIRALEQRAVVRSGAGIDVIQSPAGAVASLNFKDVVYAYLIDREQFTNEDGYTDYRYSWQEINTSRVDGSCYFIDGGRRGNKNLLDLNRNAIPLTTNNRPTIVAIRRVQPDLDYWYVLGISTGTTIVDHDGVRVRPKGGTLVNNAITTIEWVGAPFASYDFDNGGLFNPATPTIITLSGSAASTVWVIGFRLTVVAGIAIGRLSLSGQIVETVGFTPAVEDIRRIPAHGGIGLENTNVTIGGSSVVSIGPAGGSFAVRVTLWDSAGVNTTYGADFTGSFWAQRLR